MFLLPVEVRCYMFGLRCLARDDRCDTMSHLNVDAILSYMSRAKRLMSHHITPHRRRVYSAQVATVTENGRATVPLFSWSWTNVALKSRGH